MLLPLSNGLRFHGLIPRIPSSLGVQEIRESSQIVGDIAERQGAPRTAALLAQGSAARALEIADPEAMREKEDFMEATEAAISAPDLRPGRGSRTLAPATATDYAGNSVFSHKTWATQSRASFPERPDFAELLARRHEVVLAMNERERNVQPTLVLDSMLLRLRRA